LKITASALNGVPSTKVTPGRSWKVHTVPVALACHELARSGTTCGTWLDWRRSKRVSPS